MRIITTLGIPLAVLGLLLTFQQDKSSRCADERAFFEETNKEITYITHGTFYDIGLPEGACYPQDGQKYLPPKTQPWQEKYISLRKDMDSFRQRMIALGDAVIAPAVNDYLSAVSKLITHCMQNESYDALRRKLELATCELINALKENMHHCPSNGIVNPCDT